LNVILCLLLCAGAGAHAGEPHEWQCSGDARGGVYASERRARLRQELEVPTGTRRRQDRDLYVRLSARV
jgi:hypothetical protein